MLSVKARKEADTIFQVFGMTQLRIKPSLAETQRISRTLRTENQSKPYLNVKGKKKKIIIINNTKTVN